MHMAGLLPVSAIIPRCVCLFSEKEYYKLFRALPESTFGEWNAKIGSTSLCVSEAGTGLLDSLFQGGGKKVGNLFFVLGSSFSGQ